MSVDVDLHLSLCSCDANETRPMWCSMIVLALRLFADPLLTALSSSISFSRSIIVMCFQQSTLVQKVCCLSYVFPCVCLSLETRIYSILLNSALFSSWSPSQTCFRMNNNNNNNETIFGELGEEVEGNVIRSKKLKKYELHAFTSLTIRQKKIVHFLCSKGTCMV